MSSIPPADSDEDKKSFKIILLAIVMAIIAFLQAVVRKPFSRL